MDGVKKNKHQTNYHTPTPKKQNKTKNQKRKKACVCIRRDLICEASSLIP